MISSFLIVLSDLNGLLAKSPNPASIPRVWSLIVEFAIYVCLSCRCIFRPSGMGITGSGCNSILTLRGKKMRVRFLSSRRELKPVGIASASEGKLEGICWEFTMSAESDPFRFPVSSWKVDVQVASPNQNDVDGSDCLVTRYLAIIGRAWWTPSGDIPSVWPPMINLMVIKNK